MPEIRNHIIHRLAAWGLMTDAAGAATREAAEHSMHGARRAALVASFRSDFAALADCAPPPLHQVRRG